MKTVPVFLRFGDEHPIGHLVIDEARLPSAPTFFFTLGFQALEMEGITPGTVPSAVYVSKYELESLQVSYDHEVLAYLKSVGVA